MTIRLLNCKTNKMKLIHNVQFVQSLGSYFRITYKDNKYTDYSFKVFDYFVSQ